MFKSTQETHDSRNQKVVVGDVVVYLTKPRITGSTTLGVITIHTPRMAISSVAKLEYDPDSGFAEVGPTIQMTLLDGNVITGDGENGYTDDVYKLPK